MEGDEGTRDPWTRYRRHVDRAISRKELGCKEHLTCTGCDEEINYETGHYRLSLDYSVALCDACDMFYRLEFDLSIGIAYFLETEEDGYCYYYVTTRRKVGPTETRAFWKLWLLA